MKSLLNDNALRRLVREELERALRSKSVQTVLRRLIMSRENSARIERLLTKVIRLEAARVSGNGKKQSKGPTKGPTRRKGQKLGKGGSGQWTPRRVKSLRKDLGLPASLLGDLLGLSDQAIYNWEAGKCKPSLKFERKLSEISKWSDDQLVKEVEKLGYEFLE